MRFERTIAVVVLAAGVICGGNVVAANPEGGATSPPLAPGDPDGPRRPPGLKTVVGTNPWIPAEVAPAHAILAGLAGKFTTAVRVYSGPYARMFDTEGVAEGKLLMGGAFIQFTHAEKRMKQPFEAMTIYGFDQATGKYAASSVDSLSTAIVTYIGNYDAEKKQFVLSGRFSDQKSRVLTIVRRVITFVDATTWTLEEFVSNKAGDPETKIVTITFKRS